MFKHFLTLLFLVIGLDSFSQSPPNAVKIELNKFIDKTEVSVLHWMEFLYFVKMDSTPSYYDWVVPDSVTCPPSFFKNAINRNLPIMGLTRWQMEQYCIWKSEVVSKKINSNIEYRLPTKEEWLMAYHQHAGKEKVIGRLTDVNFGKYKLKGMTSNVSELVSELDIVMGNNWRFSNEVFLESDLLVDSDRPHEWVGFRCVAVIKD